MSKEYLPKQGKVHLGEYKSEWR